ncbi:unnamed protein product [marine sediment metagenome]|uniref:Uncharacterized protein n=1 Tax=marine sediment metagenome TaxID=412755 RepID=X0ZR11_9ZZZZ
MNNVTDKHKNRNRAAQLTNLGLIFNGNEFILDDINVHWTEVICDDNEKWDKMVQKIKAEIERRGYNEKVHKENQHVSQDPS